jgi:hypothetical protein
MKALNSTKLMVMMLALVGIVHSLGCRTKTVTLKSDATQSNTVSVNEQTTYPTEPGTCIIQGYLIHIFPVDRNETDEPCKSFPCKALMIVTKSRSCGFGVQNKPVNGDTLSVNFIHSLASSEEFKNVYPAKVILPGLPVDRLFEAQIKIKIAPGDKLRYEISDYELLH